MGVERNLEALFNQLYILEQPPILFLSTTVIQTYQMQEVQRKATTQLIQHPPLPPNPKTQANGLSPREPYLTRTNSNSKSFKKPSVQKSTKQMQIEQKLKYALPCKIESSFERSIVRSQNNLGQLFIQGEYEDSLPTINHTKAYSKSKKDDRECTGVDKGNSTKPFDVLSGASYNEQKSKDKNDDYYLYWKGKAHEYLQSNMKLMEDIRRLTRENEQLKHRVEELQLSANSIIKKEINSSQLIQQSIKRQENRSSSYLVQKMEEMQRELKKKEIVVKSYEEKIRELNSRMVADSQRTKLINRLKSQIDSLKAQLNAQPQPKKNYNTGQDNVVEERFRTMNTRGDFRGKNFERG